MFAHSIKKCTMKINFKIFLLLISLVSASCMHSVRIQVLKPSEITIDPQIKTIVLVNRYKPDHQNAWLNVIEGLFTGEFMFTDRKGAENALEGLRSELANSPRYKLVLANKYLEGNGSGFFPDPLNTTIINQLCSQFNADAVLAIEVFDSDIALASKPMQRKKNINKKEVIQTYFLASENVKITMGWRIYQGGNGAILDQHQMFNQMQFTAEGPTDLGAKSALLNPEQAVMKTAFVGGQVYSNRIAARWTYIDRSFYSKAKKENRMKQATRLADDNQWEKAAGIWKELATSQDEKIAGRATYNLAVASEVLDKHELALDWAKRSAYQFHNPLARDYIAKLQGRMEEINRLDIQMDKKK